MSSMREACSVCGLHFDVQFRYQMEERQGGFAFYCSQGCLEQNQRQSGDDGAATCDACATRFRVELVSQVLHVRGQRRYACSMACRSQLAAEAKGLRLGELVARCTAEQSGEVPAQCLTEGADEPGAASEASPPPPSATLSPPAPAAYSPSAPPVAYSAAAPVSAAATTPAFAPAAAPVPLRQGAAAAALPPAGGASPLPPRVGVASTLPPPPRPGQGHPPLSPPARPGAVASPLPPSVRAGASPLPPPARVGATGSPLPPAVRAGATASPLPPAARSGATSPPPPLVRSGATSPLPPAARPASPPPSAARPPPASPLPPPVRPGSAASPALPSVRPGAAASPLPPSVRPGEPAARPAGPSLSPTPPPARASAGVGAPLPPATLRGVNGAAPAPKASVAPTAPSSLPRLVAVFNHKGGTGKTTTSVSLAAGLALRGKRVLLVDADAQGNVAVSLGVTAERSLYHVLVMGLAPKDAITTVRPGLDLLPSNETLAAAELYLAGRQNRDRVLAARLGPALDGYDYVVVDCSPSLSLLNQNALCLVDSVLVPVACDYLSLVGVRQVIKTVKNVNQLLHHPVRIWGVLPTFFDARAKICHEAVDTLKKHFGDRCLRPVRQAIKVKEAPAQGQTIFEYAAGTPAAEDYANLVETVLGARAASAAGAAAAAGSVGNVVSA